MNKNTIELVISPKEKDIGIPVRRVLPWSKKRMIGPFIFLDEMGPALLKAPNDHLDVRPHPHIGLSTLTFLFEGQLMHKDSLGVEQLIVPGEVNWMTAGKGISHSERETLEIRKHDRPLHGLQFWVALPKQKEEMEPSFNHYKTEDIPVIDNELYTATVVAGSAFGSTSKLEVHSPMTFVVFRAKNKGFIQYQKDGHEHGIYIVKGKVAIDKTEYGEAQMVVFKKDSAIEIECTPDSLFVLIGGEQLPEERYIWWNFVSSSKERILLAREQWMSGAFPQVPNDDEKIPVPDDISALANYP